MSSSPKNSDDEEKAVLGDPFLGGTTPPDSPSGCLLREEDSEVVPSYLENGNLEPDLEHEVLRLFKTVPSSSYSSLMPYQIPQVKEVLRVCFPDTVHHIVDATAHIGGDSILFASVFPTAHITSIDIDPHTVTCLRHNIEHFSTLSRFDVVCANSVEWIKRQGAALEIRKLHGSGEDNLLPIPEADFYYFDPPWGGPKYYTKKEISLFIDSSPIVDVINAVFALSLTKKVLLKVPRNFAYPSFKSAVKGICKLFYIKKPQKNGSIAYGLILVTKS